MADPQSLHSWYPAEAPKAGKGPTELDRRIMAALGLSEDEYFKQVEAASRAEPGELAALPQRPLGLGSSLAMSLNSEDQRMMKLFGMNESEWRAAMAADKARAERDGSGK